MTPGVSELETPRWVGAVTSPGPRWYAMKRIDRPSVERFSASSDLELKLVTIMSVGTASVPSRSPLVLRLSRKIGEVIPKLPSGPSLLKTVGYVPSATAVAHFTFTVVVPPASSGSVTVRATQPGGRVCPTETVDAFPV